MRYEAKYRERNDNAMELLEVRGVSKRYKDFSLENIDFVLPKGFIMGYVGQNGAGKTTTINVITHVCKQQKGEVWVDGHQYDQDPVRYRESIGYISEEFGFEKLFTLKEIRKILNDFYPTFNQAYFDELVMKWSLPEKKPIGDFSKGMKVKLMFATVFARETKLLILDEATNGLDPVVRQEVLQLLQEYIADGEHSVLFSTHILSDLEQIADYIYFIHDGRKVLYDAKDELTESYLYVKGSEEMLTEELRGHLIGIMNHAYGFEAILPSSHAGLLTKDFVYEKPDIDRIVIHFIKEREGKR